MHTKIYFIEPFTKFIPLKISLVKYILVLRRNIDCCFLVKIKIKIILGIIGARNFIFKDFLILLILLQSKKVFKFLFVKKDFVAYCALILRIY